MTDQTQLQWPWLLPVHSACGSKERYMVAGSGSVGLEVAADMDGFEWEV